MKSLSGLALALSAAAIALVTGFILAVAEGPFFRAGLDLMTVLLLAAVGLGLAALWAGFTLLDERERRERLLRAEVLGLEPGSALLRGGAGRGDSSTDALARAVEALLVESEDERRARRETLLAVLGSLARPVIVVDSEDRVILADSRLDEVLTAPPEPGGSLAALLPEGALAGARDGTAAIALPGGALLHPRPGQGLAHLILEVEAQGLPPAGMVRADLSLFLPPPPPGLAAELADLEVVVFDTETTGLDPALDRFVSLAGVRVRGRRIDDRARFDRLARPDRAIAAEARRVHGIGPDDIATAENDETVCRAFLEWRGERVLVGHHLGFDLAMLRNAAPAAFKARVNGPFLDTAHLLVALDASARDPALEEAARRLGVQVTGRHSALGDALTTARVWQRLRGLMADRGVTTLAEALDLATRARTMREAERARGWIVQ